ncbi:MAG: Eco57I restriction-modification methylase domain-containing protein, partial [Chlorobi bacterium]|nr:Eco57I restriction-modification methylase domain-containing protein [Chlorobiota bacterium]
MTPHDPRFIRRIAERLDDPTGDNLRRLFGEDLGWKSDRGTQQLDVSKPIGASLPLERIARAGGVQVFALAMDRLPTLTERRAIMRALQPIAYHHVVIYRAEGELALVWTNAGSRDTAIELRLLPYTIGAPARTTLERLAHLHLPLDRDPSLADVLARLDDAFSVEAVTEQFFDDYRRVFHTLEDMLARQTGDVRWAHDYALQLLNRIVFLYFIQRKRFAEGEYWLGNDPRFILHFWQAYKTSARPKDTFFAEWLSVLFFEAFNNRFQAGRSDRRYLPDAIRDALAQAPYLNGGLFSRNRLDEQYAATVTDDFFALLFDEFDGSTPGFLERYNFTIAESTPFEVEVAVDPEMIGKVYESLVNITSEGIVEEDQRGSAGIFYTSRVEIDLMCRLALVDALANRLGADKKPLLYDAVFAYEPAEKEAADAALAAHNLWPELDRQLRDITICDPACGSGSFLVGMLLVLDDLQARANAQLGREETPYERRRRIIGEQLYGVDVMDWAVHVAELRLWLQLVVETDLEPAELKFRPLLPNLSFKIRCGDSLVQEIGGIDFGLHRAHLDISPHLKGRLTQLKGKKLRFYQGEQGLRETDIKKEELDLFRDILDHKRHALQNHIAAFTRQIESPAEQVALPGMDAPTDRAAHQRRLEQLRAEREEKQAELARITSALGALRSAQQVPFVWDIAFVEIFEGDKGGFDIVIGNPPYVRQEKIAPPTLDPNDFGGETSDRWKEQKKAYKAKLQQSVAAAWPRFFRYRPGRADFRKLDGKSDLYIYFYLHGLALLNPQGSFCFITSNSWLDVGYGADLQEFLLKHSHVKFILDNERKRSFAQADVNTIIALLAPPDDRREHGLEHTARFVMFTVPFEEVLSAETFKALEAATERRRTDRWRITVVPQRQLFEEGVAREEDEEATPGKPTKSRGPLIKTARYEANKWGGKYLRAPEIFFTILEKGRKGDPSGRPLLVRLGDIAEVRRGFTTGANEFFYLDEE